MKSIQMVFGLMLGLYATNGFANIDCSTANGSATYLESHYSGGPPPPPGFEVGRIEWKLAGNILLRSLTCTPGRDLPRELSSCGGDSEIHDDDLTARFIPGAEKTIYESPANEAWHYVRKYLSLVEFVRPSGKPLPTGLPQFEDFVLCTDSTIFAP